MQYNYCEKWMITRGTARYVWRGKEPFPSVLYLTTFFHSLPFLSPLPYLSISYLSFSPSLPLLLLPFLFPFPTSLSSTFPFPSFPTSLSPTFPFPPFPTSLSPTFPFPPFPTSLSPNFPFPRYYLSFS